MMKLPPPKKKTDGRCFFRFKVTDGNQEPFEIGQVCCRGYTEANVLVRKTWNDRWKIIPNGIKRI